MQGAVVVPHRIAIMVLGEVTYFHPDPIHTYLASRAEAGKSMVGDSTMFLAGDERMLSLLQPLVDNPECAQHQLATNDPSGKLALVFSTDVLGPEQRRVLEAHYTLYDAEEVILGPDTRGFVSISFDPMIMLEVNMYPQTEQFAYELWQFIYDGMAILFPHHVDVSERDAKAKVVH